MIDINYASRDPQIVIRQKESDDPRDKLVSMFTGQSMPGVRDGYCKIERFAETNGETNVTITPVHPVDLIKHIPTIALLAESNGSIDTRAVPETYRGIIETECRRIGVGGEEPAGRKEHPSRYLGRLALQELQCGEIEAAMALLEKIV